MRLPASLIYCTVRKSEVTKRTNSRNRVAQKKRSRQESVETVLKKEESLYKVYMV